MRETAIPYACVLELYSRTLQQERAQPGEQACACHCGKRVRGKQKYATHGCRQRVYQKALAAEKPAPALLQRAGMDCKAHNDRTILKDGYREIVRERRGLFE